MPCQTGDPRPQQQRYPDSLQVIFTLVIFLIIREKLVHVTTSEGGRPSITTRAKGSPTAHRSFRQRWQPLAQEVSASCPSGGPLQAASRSRWLPTANTFTMPTQFWDSANCHNYLGKDFYSF